MDPSTLKPVKGVVEYVGKVPEFRLGSGVENAKSG